MTLHYTPMLYECSCCHEKKPLSDFYEASYTGQRTKQCIQCINIKRKVTRDSLKISKFVSKEKIRGMEQIDYNLEDWRTAMLHFKGSCAFCGAPEGRAKVTKLDHDHLIPLSKGGKATRGNIIPACKKCNRGRGNKDWLEWFKQQPFYSVEKARVLVDWIILNK